MITRRAYLKEPGRFEIEERELVLKSNQILVKIKLCGLCNWELNFWWGTDGPDGYYQNYDGVLGHEWAGIVEAVGEDVTKFQVGDKVTYLPGENEFGGFSEYSVFDERDCYKLNPDVDLYNAMGEPSKCITTVLRNAAPVIGDNGLIQGCGPMGLWCIQGLKSSFLSSIIAVDVDDDKLALAKKYGATHTVNPMKENAEERIAEITGGRLCDFAIEGTGNSGLLQGIMRFLRQQGRLIIMSTYSKKIPEFDLTLLNEKCIKIFPAHPESSPNEKEDMERAVQLINRGTFHNEDIISYRFKLEDINKAFDTLNHKPKDYIKGIIEF